LFWFRWWLAFLPFEFGIVLEDEVFVMISGYRGVPRQGIDLQLFHAKKYGGNLFNIWLSAEAWWCLASCQKCLKLLDASAVNATGNMHLLGGVIRIRSNYTL
jgi:hypothetical protein